MINPPVLKAPTSDGLFHLESDTSREGMGGTLLQKQGDEWVVIGYHSKRLPKSAKNFGVTELELTGLLVNIHGFMQLLHNRYFKVLVDHKAIKYKYLLAPHTSALQMNTTKFKQDFIGPLFIDTALDKTHYRLEDTTGFLLDGTYHVNRIKKGSACTPLGIVDKFDTYETALKNTLLNKFAIETPNNKLQEVTLQDGSKSTTPYRHSCQIK